MAPPLLLVVLSQLTPLPAPVSEPPQSRAPLPVEAGASAYASVGSNAGVAVFVSHERSLRLGLRPQDDLWAARWDGTSVTTRLLCSDGSYSEPRIDSNGSRALILSRRVDAGLVATSIDDQLRIQSAQCAVPLESRATESHRVAAVRNDYLVTYQLQGDHELQLTWLDQQAANPASLAVPIGRSAIPFPVEANGGGFILHRTPVGLGYVQATVRGGTISVYDGGTVAQVRGLTLARAVNGPPWYSVWLDAGVVQGVGYSALAAGQIESTPIGGGFVRLSDALDPPAPAMADVGGALAIASWSGGTPIVPRLDRIPGVTRFLDPATAVPVGMAARPRPAVMVEYLGALSLIPFSEISGEQEPIPPVALTMRPSHQQSINVVWTALGWLVVWEEVEASATRTARERTALRAALWNADQMKLDPLPFSATSPVIPLSRPRVRRRPNGGLVIGLTQLDGDTTLRDLTTDGQTVTIGSMPLGLPGALHGFEVGEQRILRWVAITGGTRFVDDLNRFTDIPLRLAPGGAVAANRVIIPIVGAASVSVVDLGAAGPPAPDTVPLNLGPQAFVTAVGAGPLDQPNRVAMVFERVDGGVGSVLYDVLTAQTQLGMAPRVVAGGAPASLDREFVAIGRSGGGALGAVMIPSLRSPALLDPRVEPITEMTTAASSDGGAVAVAWIAWDSAQAGLRLRVQELKWLAAVPDASVPDASVSDASVPDASVSDASVPLDAGAPDAGPSGDAGMTEPGGGETLTFTPACGCQPFDAGAGPAAFVLLTLAMLRRKSQ